MGLVQQFFYILAFGFPCCYDIEVIRLINFTPVYGGSVFDAIWILSPATCVDQGGIPLYVTLGTHDLTVAEPSQVTIVTSEYVAHPSWNNPFPQANDIALIKLSTPISFTGLVNNLGVC